jgi:hypothetical protein
VTDFDNTSTVELSGFFCQGVDSIADLVYCVP